MHEHEPAEPPPELGRHEQPDLARRRAAEQAAGHEDGHLPHTAAVELVRDGGDRLVARAVLDAGNRQRGLLDDDRRRPARRDELLERRPVEWKRQGVADGGRNVLDLVAGRMGSQHDVVRSRLRDDDPGVREQRNAGHVARRAAAAETPSATKRPPDSQRLMRAAARPRLSRPASASASSA